LKEKEINQKKGPSSTGPKKEGTPAWGEESQKKHRNVQSRKEKGEKGFGGGKKEKKKKSDRIALEKKEKRSIILTSTEGKERFEKTHILTRGGKKKKKGAYFPRLRGKGGKRN